MRGKRADRDRAGRRNAQRKLSMAYQVYQIEAPLNLTSFRRGKKENKICDRLAWREGETTR
jgi:hypothetical protein